MGAGLSAGRYDPAMVSCVSRAGVVALFLVAGCSGAIASLADAGADASGADGGVVDAGEGDSTTDGGFDASRATCTAQLETLDALRQATRKCCPTCNTVQCSIVVADLCCPIGATNAAAAMQMTDAVNRYKAQCGPVACPAMPCTVEPSGVCDPMTSLCR